jgi:hypothetical protein
MDESSTIAEQPIRSPARCAIRHAGTGLRLDQIERFAASLGYDSTDCFAPRDDDQLDARVGAGRYDCVIFATVDDLLDTMWRGRVHLDRWREQGVRVELADPGGARHADWRVWIDEIERSLAGYRAAQQKREVLAGVLLSVIALLAVAVLYWLNPVGH